jgi:hypothetical protein
MNFYTEIVYEDEESEVELVRNFLALETFGENSILHNEPTV